MLLGCLLFIAADRPDTGAVVESGGSHTGSHAQACSSRFSRADKVRSQHPRPGWPLAPTPAYATAGLRAQGNVIR